MNFQGVGHFRNLFNQEILFHLSTSALTKKLKKKKKPSRTFQGIRIL